MCTPPSRGLRYKFLGEVCLCNHGNDVFKEDVAMVIKPAVKVAVVPTNSHRLGDFHRIYVCSGSGLPAMLRGHWLAAEPAMVTSGSGKYNGLWLPWRWCVVTIGFI
ncbi:hypothetical protein LSAT2_004978, partial [Lamellibrachia satsuma]